MKRLGKYQLLDPIGAGPCGTVSRAKIFGVVGFEREFAIKQFYPAAIASAGTAQALSTAARAYAALEHPRIAKMHEFLVAQGQTFAAVECVAGLDAGRLTADLRIADAVLPAGGVLAVLSQCARAIGFAHGRGLFHLGICPANVVLLPEGDCKVTDFGFLNACMPPRAVAEPRLARRIGYLAPEQLVGEPVSAATDVFALGILGFEMLTGRITFDGETPMEVQQAVLSSQPPEPALPRAIVRVLQRALARSPFERYPDARAFADALDAAIRIAPVPGTRTDIGDRVRAALARRAELHDEALSGVVPLPTAPFERVDTEGTLDFATEEFVRDPVDLIGVLPHGANAGILPTTLAGVVVPVVAPPYKASSPVVLLQPPPLAAPAIATSSIGQRSTQQGLPPAPRMATSPASRPPPLRALTDDLMIPHEPLVAALPPTSDPTQEFGNDVTIQADDASTGEFRDLAPVGWVPPHAPAAVLANDAVGAHRNVAAPVRANSASVPPLPNVAQTAAAPLPPSRDPVPRWLWIVIGFAGAAGLVGGGWALLGPTAKQSTTVAAVPRIDARTAVAMLQADAMPSTPNPPNDGASVASLDAANLRLVDAPLALAKIDAQGASLDASRALDAAKVIVVDAAAPVVATVDAGRAVVRSSGDEKSLHIDSTPAGARVYLDGADVGVTPLTLPGSADHHSAALVLANHDLYLAEIDGHGRIAVALAAVTPAGGTAGIKVRCKDKDRYYVFIDAKPTGQLCPTEKIEVNLGEHIIEIYDVTSESRRQFPVVVKSNDRSLRVRID